MSFGSFWCRVFWRIDRERVRYYNQDLSLENKCDGSVEVSESGSAGSGLTASGSDPYLDVPPEVFIGRLEGYERVLVDLKDQLYEGSWERILADLRARLDGKPYIFKLSQTIARDMAAIERMKSFEMRHNVSLSKLLRKEPS
jgi:hypothetical protein